MQKLSMAAGVAMIILLAVLIVWQADILGVPEGKLEQDARKAQQIEDSWEVVRDINGDMCAMLFYDNARRSCTYSIYLTRNGMSYGYFFGQGGLDAYMVEGVKGLKFEDGRTPPPANSPPSAGWRRPGRAAWWSTTTSATPSPTGGNW